MARKTRYDEMCERLGQLGHDPHRMTLRQMNDALLAAGDPLGTKVEGNPLVEEKEEAEKPAENKGKGKRMRKQKTEAQRAKAKATVERLVAQSRKETVDEFVRLIEGSGLNWVKEWSIRNAGYDVNVFDPYNPITGTHYSGGNRFSLSMHCFSNKLADNRFCTWNQANKMGWSIQKGATPLIIEKWLPQTWYQRDESGEVVTDDNGNPVIGGRKMKLVSCFKVYNLSEIDGAPQLEKKEAKAPERQRTELDDMIDALKDSSRCLVRERVSERAYYSPLPDRITVPLREEFTSLQSALRTLLHEMGHSTGHESALNRNVCNRFGTKDYAFEELIAELTSVFTASYLNAELAADDADKHKKNHAAYLQSWLKKLQSDPDYLYKAAASAAKASDYIIKRLVDAHPEYERTTETLEMPEETKAA